MRADKHPASGYDAFISYSQAVSGRLAAALQHWLERFATPWYRPRALRIFRDYTSLSASDDLWQSIERALSLSAHLILLASPAAVESRWVNREVRWWRDNKPAEKVFIVLTSGELRWDQGRNDWDPKHTASLPPAAFGMFVHEPLWVDLSAVQTTSALDRSNPVLLNSVAQIAAPLRGIDKDAIVGEHIAYYRRARLQRRGGIAALAFLTAAAVVAASLARIQADNAAHQARIATGRALAAAAVQDLASNLRLSQLLAVEAYQLNPDAESRSALFQAVTASPALVRYLSADSTVTTVAASGNGTYLLAGTQDGHVFRWSTAGFRRTMVAKLRGSITSVSTSYTGTTVAAADGAVAVVWTSRNGVLPIVVPAGQRANLTGVSPSGRYVLVTSYLPRGYPVRGAATLHDMQTGLTRRSAVNNPAVFPTTAVVVPSDRQAVLLNALYGPWQQLGLPALTRLASGGFPFGFHNRASALSPDGEVAAGSNGDPLLSIYAVQPNSANPRFQAAGAGPFPTAIAISANHQMAATAANGSIYVARIGNIGASEPSPIQLQGSPDINSGALAFVGTSGQLISASGPAVAFWNLNQLSRNAMQIPAAVPQTCNACYGDWLSVSPAGRMAAVYDPAGPAPVTLQQLDAPFGQQLLLRASAGPRAIGPVAWAPDGRRMYVPTSAGIEVRSGVPPWPPVQQRWPDPMAGSVVKAISTSANGKYLIVVGSTNTIEIRSAETGKVIDHFPGPDPGSAADLAPNAEIAAVSADGTVAAIITRKGGVDVINLATRRVIPLRVARVGQIAIGGSYLVILLYDGSVDLWNLSANRFDETGAKDNVGAIAIDQRGTLLAEYTEAGTVILQNPVTAQTIGSFQAQPLLLATFETSLAFSADDTKLVVAIAGDGARNASKMELLDLSGMRWASAACVTAGAGMTGAEWRAVVGTSAPPKLACGGTS